MANSKVGRPSLTPEEIKEKKRDILSKIEPYLKTGLSVNKALREAHIGNREFYEFMSADEHFREKINEYRQFVSVLVNNAIVKELMNITAKQAGGKKTINGKEVIVPPKSLDAGDKDFLKWMALNSNSTKQEFGERKDINLYDPEAEIQKVHGILEEETNKDIGGDEADYTV